MSRDRKPSGVASDADARGADAPELLAAYVDGVAELPVDERRAVERWLDGNDAARAEAAEVHGLLDQLRALPASDAGGEPDWAAMERSIRHAVADAPIRPWWRRWQWLVPAMTCVTAAAVLVVVWPRPRAVPVRVPERAPIAAPVPVTPEAAASAGSPAPGEDGFALWLDGRVVEVDPAASPAAVDDVLGDLEAPAAGEALDEDGLLPASDLAWLDALDDAELARAERWLAEPDGGDGGAGASERGHRSPYRKKS